MIFHFCWQENLFTILAFQSSVLYCKFENDDYFLGRSHWKVNIGQYGEERYQNKCAKTLPKYFINGPVDKGCSVVTQALTVHFLHTICNSYLNQYMYAGKRSNFRFCYRLLSILPLILHLSHQSQRHVNVFLQCIQQGNQS